MINRNNNIKNKLAYFYKVIKNMDLKDSIKQSEIDKHETSLDEILYSNFSDNTDVDKQLSEKTLLGWIELIENPDLYKALKGLTIEDQIFISYIVKECKTQQELVKMYHVSVVSIYERFHKISRKLKNNLSKKMNFLV